MVIIEQIIPFHVCVLINIGGIAHIYADPADIHGFKHSWCKSFPFCSSLFYL